MVGRCMVERHKAERCKAERTLAARCAGKPSVAENGGGNLSLEKDERGGGNNTLSSCPRLTPESMVRSTMAVTSLVMAVAPPIGAGALLVLACGAA